jgi:hypothetical protein
MRGHKTGVEIDCRSFSFRSMPFDAAIRAMQEIGCRRCEVYFKHLEPELPREELRKWRTSVDKGKRRVVNAGDKIPLAGVEVLAVCSRGKAISGGRPNLACGGIELRREDYEEDGQSIGLLFTLGKYPVCAARRSHLEPGVQDVLSE